MKKILCACGNGMGSSIIIKIKVEQVLKELEVDGIVQTASISEAKGLADEFDFVICSKYLEDDLKNSKAKIIGLENLLDSEAIKVELKKFLINEQ